MRLNDWLKQASVELVILQGAGGARGPLAELVNNVVASLAEFERDLIARSSTLQTSARQVGPMQV